MNGRKITSKILKNKITFINLWFEACVPCLAETAALNNLYEEYKHQKKFQFFSFTFETKENVERIVKKYNFKFRILLISLDSIKLINYEQGFPVSMIIDKKGKISLFTAGGPSNPKMAQEKFNIFIKPALNLKLRKKKMYN